MTNFFLFKKNETMLAEVVSLHLLLDLFERDMLLSMSWDNMPEKGDYWVDYYEIWYTHSPYVELY